MPFDGLLAGTGRGRHATPQHQARGGLTKGLYNRLWSAARLAVLVQPRGVQQFDHVRRTVGANVGNPTITIDPIMGPCWLGDGTGDAQSFAAHPWAANLDVTFMAVGQTAANSRPFGHTSTGLGGLALFHSVANTLRLVKNGVANVDSSYSLSTGVPYVHLCSYRVSDEAVRFVSRRLDTNAVSSSAMTSAGGSVAGNGSFWLGGYDATPAISMQGRIAALYIGNLFLDTGDLTAFSADPWGLWREAPGPKSARVPDAPAGDDVVSPFEGFLRNVGRMMR
jgi:hypothetical protein